jgi:hypothetical protein
MTPEIKITILRQETIKRLKASLLAFIYNSPIPLVCDVGRAMMSFHFTEGRGEVKVGVGYILLGGSGDWRLETGDWRLEIGDWRLEIGDWGLTIYSP